MSRLSLTRHIVPFLFLITLLIGAATADAATLYGVTVTNQLVRFDSLTPATTLTNVGPVTGLQVGEVILGMDFRPSTGQLFAIGSTSRLYIINKLDGSAKLVGVLSTSLNGVDFGFDFNPTVDRIRIVSSTGQNLRVDPNTAAVTVDNSLNPAPAHVTAAAYTNSYSGSASTTLFVIDTQTDVLFTQNPPNNGTLVTVGSLSVNASDANGFDHSTSTGLAYAALTVSGLQSLFTINLFSGTAIFVGSIGSGNTTLRAMSVDSGSSAQNLTVYGLTAINQLVRFNSRAPNTILNSVAITGLQPGELLQGIDFRPATGRLYGAGATNRLYIIDVNTGVASQVGSAFGFNLNGNDFGFDFNPVPDRIRIVSDLEQNIRVNPDNGILAATDSQLAFAAGDPNAGQNPTIVAAAYTNSFGGSTTTTLYDIDSNLDILVTQNPPNNGILNTVGPLGVNATSMAAFDAAPGNNSALAAFQLMGDAASKLYSIDLTTGFASFIGPIGTVGPLRGIAIVPGSTASTTVDFDGDRRTDFSVFRPSINSWLINRSSDGVFVNTAWGLSASDVLTPGDYDGDGRTDVAVWRRTDGFFYVLRSSDNQPQYFQFGRNGDEPVARDYDGDGKTDFSVVRRSSGALIWYIANSVGGTFRAEQFGLSTDTVAPGDYDGDGRFDLGVRRGTGDEPAVFYTQNSTNGFNSVQWGLGSDLIAPGDYDGDGRTDYTAVRGGAPFTWYTLSSSTFNFNVEQIGTGAALLVQGDYDGDGRTDVAVWDPATGTYSVMRSSTRARTITQFGQSGDDPIANFDVH